MKEPKYHKAVASLAAENNSIREELKSVKYADGTATATDAFRAIIARAPAFVGIDGLIEASHASKYVDELGITGYIPRDASAYPNVQKVLDNSTEKEPIATVSVNVSYLADICKALAPFASSINNVVIEFRGAGEPLVFRAKKCDEVQATAMLMPMRS